MTIKTENLENIPGLIKNAIEHELKQMIESRYETMKNDFIEKIERDKAVTLAGISLYIMKQINMEQMGSNIHITLRTEQK